MSVDQPQPRTLAPRTLEQDQILLDELADLGLDFARDLKPAPTPATKPRPAAPPSSASPELSAALYSSSTTCRR